MKAVTIEEKNRRHRQRADRKEINVRVFDSGHLIRVIFIPSCQITRQVYLAVLSCPVLLLLGQ